MVMRQDLRKGIGQKAFRERPVGADAHHDRLQVRFESVSHAEEIAEGSVDARDLAAVVVDAEAKEPRPSVLAGRHRDPQVARHAGTFEVRENRRLSGNGTLAVVVRIQVGVVGRAPVGGEVLGLEEPEGVVDISLGRRIQRDEEKDGAQKRSHGAQF